MLRIHLLQHWYSLSDPAMEEALFEVLTMRRFAGIELISARILDEPTILTCRHLLEKHALGEKIFETLKAHLSAWGMTMRWAAIVRCIRPRRATSGTTGCSRRPAQR